jgi:hypothetical protein
MDTKILHELFDYRDGELYWKIQKARCIKIGDCAGSKSTSGYKYIKINGKQYSCHRLIFCMVYGYFPKEIDHIDGNSLNNRVENLREASHSDNLKNTKIPSNNKSGVKGVSWHKTTKRWYVKIVVNKKPLYIGSFKSLEQARLSAYLARIKHHGDFANHG